MSYIQRDTLNKDQQTEVTERKTTLNLINERLTKELAERNLKDIPTERLIKLIIDLNKQTDNQNILINEVKYEKGL